jgi:hypothetical protein
MPKGFYTYIWLRENGTPYYVGKGHGERAFSPYKRRFPKPQDPSCILIQEFPSEVERDGGLRLSEISKLGGNARWAKERDLHAE